MENHTNRSNSSEDATVKTKITSQQSEESERGAGLQELTDHADNSSSLGAGAETEDRASSQELTSRSSTRNPFTSLSQIDSDLALARALQEQERAYMMLTINSELSDYGSWETGSYRNDDDDDDDFDDPHDAADRDNDSDRHGYVGVHEEEGEDAFDVHAHDDEDDDESADYEVDPDDYSSDEAYARALQEAEEREMATRMLALTGLNDRFEHVEHQLHNPQDAWVEVDPDELSYEELIALGNAVGTESRGLSADTIASLPSVKYKEGSCQNGSDESCVICRIDYENGEKLTILPCNHSYHSACINEWLKINKVCPMCSREVSTSSHS